MKRFFTVVMLVAVGLMSCNDGVDKATKEKEAYIKSMKELEEKEKKSPVSFLSVSSKDKNNLLGQTVIKGSVTNNAKVCTYKDVKLEVSFFSKTGTLLETGNEVVYESIAPGKSGEFKFKNFAPTGSDSIAIKVIGAKTD
jgi:hypothetical protein